MTLRKFDWIAGISRFRLWVYLANLEIKNRYRRSTLGPFWITLSMLLMTIGIGPIYAMIFNFNLAEYYIYLAAGLIIWQFLLNTINDSTQSFIDHEKLITQINLPYSIYIYKNIYKNIIIFAHNIIALLLIAIFFPPESLKYLPLFFVGLSLVILNFFWISFLLSIVCTRYRDINQVISSLLHLSFFVTPVFWNPSQIGEYSVYVKYNIFYHFINVLRDPLIGSEPKFISYLFLLLLGLIGSFYVLIFFSKYKNKISYWI